MTEQSTRSERKQHIKREVRSWVFCLLGALILALILRFFVFEVVRVDGDSMQPTLQTNEYVFVEKVSRYFNGIHRGDIVITHYPDRTDTYVKRVVAVGGDVIKIENGYLYVNGEKQIEEYLGQPIYYTMPETAVPEGYYFVLGDNRNYSLDSHLIGAIPDNMIIGHALCVIWPFNQFEWVSGK